MTKKDLPQHDTVVTLCSGGLDSVTLAHAIASRPEYLLTDVQQTLLTINYGQNSWEQEWFAARRCALRLHASIVLVDLHELSMVFGGSALTDASVDVPEDAYSGESNPVTEVPNRNAILANIAVALAVSKGAQAVELAIHAGDHPIYPDCSPPFVDALNQLVATANPGKCVVHTPFLHMTKADIVRIGHELDVPFESTWSCYTGGVLGYSGLTPPCGRPTSAAFGDIPRPLQCGVCATCIERREAFKEVGIPDPTEYAS